MAATAIREIVMPEDCIRIIDHIRCGNFAPPWLYRVAGIEPQDLTSRLVQQMNQADRVVADNVAQYMYEVSDQEYWSILDFPNLTPTAPVSWIEFLLPTSVRSAQFGDTRLSRDHVRGEAVLVESVDVDALGERFQEVTSVSLELAKTAGVRWWQSMTAILQAGRAVKNEVRWELPIVAWCVTESGAVWMPEGKPLMRFPRLSKSVMDQHDPNGELIQVPMPCLVAAFALSLMHCNQTTVEQVRPAPGLSKRFKRRHGNALSSFKTIDIESMRSVLQNYGDVRRRGLKHALHVCRGHFKDYRSGKGLLGRHHDLFWWSEHWRGSDDSGKSAGPKPE